MDYEFSGSGARLYVWYSIVLKYWGVIDKMIYSEIHLIYLLLWIWLDIWLLNSHPVIWLIKLLISFSDKETAKGSLYHTQFNLDDHPNAQMFIPVSSRNGSGTLPIMLVWHFQYSGQGRIRAKVFSLALKYCYTVGISSSKEWKIGEKCFKVACKIYFKWLDFVIKM